MRTAGLGAIQTLQQHATISTLSCVQHTYESVSVGIGACCRVACQGRVVRENNGDNDRAHRADLQLLWLWDMAPAPAP